MQSTNLSQRKKTLFLTQFSVLLALEAIVCFTPLGSLPVGPMVATLMYLPVVVAAIMLGVKAGALMGFFSGLFSFIVWTFIPPSPVAFVFTPFYTVGEFQGNGWSIVICFVPRILVGVVAAALYSLLSRKNVTPAISCAVSGILGSLTATLLILGGIYIFFGKDYASFIDVAHSTLLGILAGVVATNGLLEAAIAGIVCVGVCVPMKKIFGKA